MLEEKLKSLIIKKYGSVRQFSLKINIPYTTVDTMLKRGINKSNVQNSITMFKELKLDLDESLEKNDIVFKEIKKNNSTTVDTNENAIVKKIRENEHILNNEDKETINFVIDKAIKRD